MHPLVGHHGKSLLPGPRVGLGNLGPHPGTCCREGVTQLVSLCSTPPGAGSWPRSPYRCPSTPGLSGLLHFMNHSGILVVALDKDSRSVSPCTGTMVFATIHAVSGSTCTAPCRPPCAGQAVPGTAGPAARTRRVVPVWPWRPSGSVGPAAPDAAAHTRCSQILVTDRIAMQVLISGDRNLSVNHQAHVCRPCPQPPGHRGQPLSEGVMLLGSRALVHNAHGQRNHIGVESSQFGQQ